MVPSADPGPSTPVEVVMVTGLSGAGRGTAARVLEDLGWYVTDNLPPELIARMVELGLADGLLDLRTIGRIAARMTSRRNVGA